jgi:hypothetical protein
MIGCAAAFFPKDRLQRAARLVNVPVPRDPEKQSSRVTKINLRDFAISLVFALPAPVGDGSLPA